VSAATGIDPKTHATQASASDPRASAWVSANAGSGKTYVLARRVIRLLLAGVDPVRILCLTFTKAAAAEMANRVFAILGSWTTLSDERLAEELADLEGAAPNADLMAAARRLFARALDTPGGLKIQTIHAFCERLLHQFPFEANVAGHFDVLEERAAQALSDQAQRSVLARAAEDEGSVLGRALKTVLSLVSDVTHRDSVAEFVAQRDKLRAWIDARGSLDGAIADLRHELQVGRHETSESVRRAVLDGVPLDDAEARRLFDLLLNGSTSDRRAAEQFTPYLTMQDEASRLTAWIGLFFKDDGDPRRNPITKRTLGRWPGLDELIDKEVARLAALLERLRTTDLFESSAAMLRLADAAIAEYSRLKQRRGVLDFEDLVVRTVALLARSDAARWVQYKLDRGLDHILVDEAQDTSPRQWQVVKALVEDFFAGEGASATVRTLFAVGDEKQSIFSFQGAVPAWFSAVQKELAARAKGAALNWHDLELHLSFRSVPVVLNAVDAVFADPEVHRGLSAEMQPTVHEARRRDEPGRVIVWPRLEQPARPQAEDWVQPVDYLGKESPEVRLAERLAETIGGWLSRGEMLDAPDEKGQARPFRAGGILILTRTRGALTDAINRALKTHHIPIAGADRLTLTEHIAVMDLMALGRVALLPEDDLSLAALLRSPLIGISEECLFDLAGGQRRTLWGALKRRANERREFALAYDRISGWRLLADQLDPHALYARILGPDGGR
jgi:ATP-dependent helicase/nuclease subunit A